MQKLLETLFGNSQADEPQQPSTPLVQPEYNQYALLAQAAISRQDWNAARAAYTEGLLTARQQENLQAQQFFLSGLGTVNYKELSFADAESNFLDALAIAQQLDMPVLIARSQINLGELFATQKLWNRAQTYHEQALDIARNSYDSTTIALALENLARAYMEQSNPAYAIHLLKEAVAIAQAAQNPRAR
jgi:tetratricopeptide (TPR) repeat protein